MGINPKLFQNFSLNTCSLVEHLAANQKISSSNPPAALREKDAAICFHKEYNLGNPQGQFSFALQSPYELESTG